MKKRIIDDAFIGQLEALVLMMRTSMQGYFGGTHKTSSYGSTVEFADFREYVLGDDIRRIDWNLYSRFEKHFIKLFVDERQMHNRLYLDCSASMGKINPRKAAYALRLVAALGFLSVHNMDKVSFGLMRGDVCHDLCGTVVGKDAFFRAVDQLEAVEFKGETVMEKAIQTCRDPGYNDGLTVIVSDFLTDSEWKKAVDFLLYRHREVMLIQVLSPEEIDPTYNGRVFLRDAESTDVTDERNMKMRITQGTFKAYQSALSDYIEDIRGFCASRGVGFISARCDEPIEKLVFGKLYESGVIK